MKTRAFGQNGPTVPVIGQGTWQLGGREGAVAALRRGIDLGMTHIDTAEMYTGSEAIVAEAIAGRRDEIFLVSKVLPANASRRGVVRACEASLKRLKTDHLDCYLLHWPGSHPIADTVDAFAELVRAGKIRRWGVSNFDVADLEGVLRVAGDGQIACNQVLYHLGERAIEHDVLPWCRQHNVAVVAYSPFGSGDFPQDGGAGMQVLEAVATAHGATPRQVALAYLVRHGDTFAIPKASNASHAAENAGAGDLALEAAEIDRIGVAFPLGAKPRRLPMI